LPEKDVLSSGEGLGAELLVEAVRFARRVDAYAAKVVPHAIAHALLHHAVQRLTAAASAVDASSRRRVELEWAITAPLGKQALDRTIAHRLLQAQDPLLRITRARGALCIHCSLDVRLARCGQAFV
jgi:hypothetical protein